MGIPKVGVSYSLITEGRVGLHSLKHQSQGSFVFYQSLRAW